MMISTKGRYALRVMIDLAEHCNGEYIPMKDVVKRQQVSPVACLDCDAEECERADQCRTLPMWKELNNRITDFFDGITIADLMKKDIDI